MQHKAAYFEDEGSILNILDWQAYRITIATSSAVLIQNELYFPWLCQDYVTFDFNVLIFFSPGHNVLLIL